MKKPCEKGRCISKFNSKDWCIKKCKYMGGRHVPKVIPGEPNPPARPVRSVLTEFGWVERPGRVVAEWDGRVM